jgi:beta-phosphoglucomutase
MKKYKALLFDMDGVIVDSMPFHAASWQKVFMSRGIDIPLMEIYRREGMSGVSSVMDILKSGGFQVPTEDEIKKLLELKLSMLESSNVTVFPLSADILDLVRSRNIKTALVTGSMRQSVNHLLPGGIISCFDSIVAVGDYKNGKPHPEPYLRAMELLSADPADSLAVENAPFGIRSAKAAGADCFAIKTTLDESYLKEADMIFDDHEGLLAYFKENL